MNDLAGEADLGALLDSGDEKRRFGRSAMAREKATTEVEFLATLHEKWSVDLTLTNTVTWIYQKPRIGQSGVHPAKRGLTGGEPARHRLA